MKLTYSTLVVRTGQPLIFRHQTLNCTFIESDDSFISEDNTIYRRSALNKITFGDSLITHKSGEVRLGLLSDETNWSNECRLRSAARQLMTQYIEVVRGLRRLA